MPPSRNFMLRATLTIAAAIVISGCGGGGNSRGQGTALGGSDAANFGCSGECAAQALASSEVRLIINQGVAAATQLGVNANFAVLDRVGNVLAVYQMGGAAETTTIHGRNGAKGGLEGVPVPASLAAISKAGTGAYLSSQANAFSSRTASQIVQEHFDPGELFQPGGPLFGVQFSQLLCSDVTMVDRGALLGGLLGNKTSAGGSVGPRPLPLGLSGDPGGFPLYKAGDVVGGIGVEIDGEYTIDRDIRDFDSNNIEETVALAASLGFGAPSERTANNILVGGKALRYSDVAIESLPPIPEIFQILDPAGLRAVPLYFAGAIRDGVPFGNPASGVLLSSRAGASSMTLVNDAGVERFPVRAGAALPGDVQLSAVEVDALLSSAIGVARRSRGAIRLPLDSAARVSIFIVDTNGTPIGFTRSADAPVFGIDVSLQKARTALFFSAGDTGSTLTQIRAADPTVILEDYAGLLAAFAGEELLRGGVAMTSRAVGNLARPFYPDGIDDTPSGPLSLPFPPAASASDRSWSPFNDGLQLDLVFQRLVRPLDGGSFGVVPLPDSCVDERLGNRLRNGIQIFAGSVPLYRNGVLIGAIGVSGDGIDQDDMIAFLGASRRGLDDSGALSVGDPVLGFNAPPEIRSDTVRPPSGSGTRLRYVNCPEGPFVGSNTQNVCDGL